MHNFLTLQSKEESQENGAGCHESKRRKTEYEETEHVLNQTSILGILYYTVYIIMYYTPA